MLINTSILALGLALTGVEAVAFPAVTTKKAVAASTVATVSASGTASVAAMSAVVPLAHAIATYDANGNAVSAQLPLLAGGSGPGICPDGKNAISGLGLGMNVMFGFLCGLDVVGGIPIGRETAYDWKTCLWKCVNTQYNCDTAVFQPSNNMCYYKQMGGVARPSLVQNSDRQFVYVKASVTNPFVFPASTSSIPTPTTFADASTTSLPASGTISLSGIASTASITGVVATVSASSTLAVKIMIRYPGH